MVKVQVLGTAQDAGIPQLGCICPNCTKAQQNPEFRRFVTSILIEGEEKTFLIDATPDITLQLNNHQISKNNKDLTIDGVIITHLHIGHYIGMLYFGKEAANTNNLSIYVTEPVKQFLINNKPFSYLIERGQVKLHTINIDTILNLGKNSEILVFEVPHRNEDGNTIGIQISNRMTNKSFVYIPDIDYITPEIKKQLINADFVLFDGSFYSENEIPRQKEVVHPPILTTISKLGVPPQNEFYFTHFNHSNPVLNIKSAEYKRLVKMGYKIATDSLDFEF